MTDEELQSLTARKERIQTWALENLFESNTQFHPERIGGKTSLFSVDFRGSLYTLLLNGYSGHADWPTNPGESQSAKLFSALSTAAEIFPATWILALCHDDAYWELRLVIPTTPDRIGPHCLWTLQRYPADEGGTSCFGLLFDDYQGLILFTDSIRQNPPDYPCGFDVEFYGSDSRRELLLQTLSKRA